MHICNSLHIIIGELKVNTEENIRLEGSNGRQDITLTSQIWDINGKLFITVAAKCPYDINENEIRWITEHIKHKVHNFTR